MKALILKLKFLKAFFTLIKDPAQTDNVFVLADSLRARNSPLMQETLSYITSTTTIDELYRASYNPKLPPLEEMAKMPDGSLGREFARHMIANGLSIDFFPHPKGTSLREYMIDRARKSHDFWHLLTGFDTSGAGEIGLQAFSYAQLRAPFPGVLISGGILHALFYKPEIFNKMMEGIFAGYQMGRRSRPLITFKFEERLSENLEDLRREFGIEPIAAANATRPQVFVAHNSEALSGT